MLNCDYNKVIVTGVPVEVPVMNKTSGGVSVFNMNLAVVNPKKKLHVDVTVWGELAEKVIGDIDTSTKIIVEGTLNRREKDEENGGRLEITANKIFAV